MMYELASHGRTDPPEMGVFILSLDVELAWGTHDLPGFQRHYPEFAKTRATIDTILALLSRYQIEATWAVVGHLFLDSCSAVGDTAHPEILVPSPRWLKGHWHQHDPCSDMASDPYWYGADIIHKLLACQIPQEIGCHTFSHVIANDRSCTAEILASQITACQGLADRQGISLRSFVYPRDAVAHIDVLREHGFRVYRGQEQRWYRYLPRPLRALVHYADRLIAFTPPTYRIVCSWEDGIVNAPGSMLLMYTRGLRRIIPGASRIRQARLGIERAVRRREMFHLRLHPWAMASSPLMVQWLEKILKIAARYRDSGQLRIMTMEEFADHVASLQQPV